MLDTKEKLLTRHEGRVNKFYYDNTIQRYVTGGIGFLCDPRLGATIPEPVIDLWFSILIKQAEESLPQWASEEALGPVRHAVLVDMSYNMGHDRLAQFVNTLELIKEGKYEEASVAMGESKWAKQVGPRAARLREMMRTGEWPSG